LPSIAFSIEKGAKALRRAFGVRYIKNQVVDGLIS